MKKFIMVLCVVAAAMMLVAPAYAVELWDEHLRGLDEGLAAGALPPPGVYFVNDLHVAVSDHLYGVVNNGLGIDAASGKRDTNWKLFAYVDIPSPVVGPRM